MAELTVAKIERWLLTEARALEFSTIVEGFGYRMRALGLPVDRMTISFGLLNPTIIAAGMIWRPGEPVRVTRWDYDQRDTSVYERSPFKTAHDEKRWVELHIPTTPDDLYGVVPDLKEEGIEQYWVIPLPDSVGGVMSATFATKDPAGFTPEHRAIVKELLPSLAAITEIKTLRSTLREVLAAYVGRQPAREIVQGTVHLGQVTRLRAAILVADLRGFTWLSTQLPPEATAELINRYYRVVVPPVEAHGGEVLKFIGDAILAVFPTAGRGDDAATLAALNAARAALDAEPAPFDLAGRTVAIRFGTAVHVGDAAFGNVGSGARLDFTVIGRDVNIAARLATLCSRLGRDYLVSADVAEIGRRNGRLMADAGAHEVRGLDRPLHVYVPDTHRLGPAFDDGVSEGLALATQG